MSTKGKHVGTIVLSIALGLIVASFLQTASVQAKNPVTRPFHIAGQASLLDVFGEAPWTAIDQGVSSEGGRYVSLQKYTSSTEGYGVFFAADGDQIFWTLSGLSVTISGGTGRFEGATGSFSIVVSSTEVVPGPEGRWSVVYTHTGEGSIRY